MITTDIKIINKLGLHARASAKFAKLARNYVSSINLQRNSQTVDGKSIMNIMMLAASKGTSLTLYVEGKDEIEATKSLTELINNKFEEIE